MPAALPPPLTHHRQELEPLFGQFALERAKAAEQRRQDWEWERYLSCTSVPHPLDRIAVADFLAVTEEGSDKQMGEALSMCQVRARGRVG